MRVLIYGLIGIVFLVTAGIAFVFMAAPTGYVRDRLIAEVKQHTGRTLTVGGRASFTVYPQLGIKLENVALSGPPGMERETFVQMDRLTLAIPLWPLLKRELAIEEFVLVRPIIQLAVDARGRRTWDFTPPTGETSREVAPIRRGEAERGSPDDQSLDLPPAAPSADLERPNGQAAGMLAGLSLGDVRIEEGEIRYANLLTASTERLTDVDVRLALSQIDAPFEISGSVAWNKKSIPFTARLETLKSFLDGAPAKLAIAIDADHVAASYDGKLDLSSASLLDGAITLNTASLRELATWAGAKLPPVGGLQALDLAAHVTVSGPAYTLSKAKLTLDGARIGGDLSLETAGSRPRLSAKIAIDKLDLNTYLAPAKADPKLAAKPAKKTKTAAGADDGEVVETASVEPAAPKAAKRAPGGWSVEPIDVGGLRLLDAELAIATGALTYEDIKIGKSRITLSLADGLLKARLPEFQAYGGKGVGALQIDGAAPLPRLTANATVNNISAHPLLTDAMAFDWVEGSGSISFGVKSEGRHVKALISALTGQGRFAFTDGAIVGFNIPGMVRGLGKGKVSGLERNERQKTDFSELSGTFSIIDGTATNKDLNLVGPLIRMAGAGSVDLPGQSLDYTVMPKLVASLEGQGGGDATGVTIPVRIQGPWAKPRVMPDFAAMAKDPEAIANTVKQLGAKLKDGDKKKINKTLEKLTGKSGANVDDLVGGILGQ